MLKDALYCSTFRGQKSINWIFFQAILSTLRMILLGTSLTDSSMASFMVETCSSYDHPFKDIFCRCSLEYVVVLV